MTLLIGSCVWSKAEGEVLLPPPPCLLDDVTYPTLDAQLFCCSSTALSTFAGTCSKCDGSIE
jgi:hypothetical protein